MDERRNREVAYANAQDVLPKRILAGGLLWIPRRRTTLYPRVGPADNRKRGSLRKALPWVFLALFLAQVPASPNEEGGCAIGARYLSPEILRERAVLLVRGEITDISTAYLRGHVYTDYHVRISEIWKGRDVPQGIVVRQVGGTFGRYRTVGAIPLKAKVGQEWILALAAPPHGWWTVYGITQGAFQVVKDSVVRRFDGYRFAAPPPPHVTRGVERLSMNELKKRLAAGRADNTPGDFPERSESALDSRSSTPRLRKAAPSRVRADESAVRGKSPTRDDQERGWLRILALPVLLLAAWMVLRARRRGLASAILGASLLSFLSGGNSAGYVPIYGTPPGSGVTWNMTSQSPAAYFQNGEVVYRIITSGPFAVPSPDFQFAIQNAAQTWEDAPDSALRLARGSDITTDPWSQGFSIGFSDAAENTQWGGSVAGLPGVGGPTTFSGSDITDADVCMNSTVTWSTDGSTSDDLESSALHEIGHAVGLDHSPHIQSQMSYVGSWDGLAFSSGPDRRLTTDDRAAMAGQYKTASYATLRGGISGTVLQSAINVHKAQIGVFDADGRLVTTTISNDGSYKVEGLVPGPYTLRAFPTFPNTDPAGLYQRADDLGWTWPAAAPTSFLTAASDDVVTVVSAGSTTSAPLTVGTGGPVMRCTHTARYSGGWLAWSKGLHLKRGETTRIAVVGSDIPNSAGALAEFTITGGGLTLSNFGYSGATTSATAPANDWPYAGARTIAFDIAVSTTADLGDRALILRSTSYPGERYLVLGLVEVFEAGSLAVAPGPANPGPGNVGPGQTDQPMLQVSLSAGGTEPVRVRSWTIAHSGTGSTANVNTVRIYRDLNVNGQADGGEPVVAAGTFSGSSAIVASSVTIPPGATQAFLITYDFGTGATSGETFAATLAGLSCSGVESAYPISSSGLPVPASPGSGDGDSGLSSGGCGGSVAETAAWGFSLTLACLVLAAALLLTLCCRLRWLNTKWEYGSIIARDPVAAQNLWRG